MLGLPVCMHVCMYVCMYVCSYSFYTAFYAWSTAMFVCMHVCMYVYVYVCVCVYIYIYTRMYIKHLLKTWFCYYYFYFIFKAWSISVLVHPSTNMIILCWPCAVTPLTRSVIPFFNQPISSPWTLLVGAEPHHRLPGGEKWTDSGSVRRSSSKGQL